MFLVNASHVSFVEGLAAVTLGVLLVSIVVVVVVVVVVEAFTIVADSDFTS
jgi:hypothetical protein